jgi:alpha-mannosidase
MPHRGDWTAGGVLQASELLNVPAIVGAAGPGPGSLPLTQSFLTIEGDGLVMNAFKQGEWDDSMVLRISNPTLKDIEGAIITAFPVKEAVLMDMLESKVEQELNVENGTVKLIVPAKKILTIRLK